jgi:predicted small lipoprotein YifL
MSRRPFTAISRSLAAWAPLALWLAAALLAVSGCGQTGPLTLAAPTTAPGDPSAEAPPPDTADSEETESEQDDC